MACLYSFIRRGSSSTDVGPAFLPQVAAALPFVRRVAILVVGSESFGRLKVTMSAADITTTWSIDLPKFASSKGDCMSPIVASSWHLATPADVWEGKVAAVVPPLVRLVLLVLPPRWIAPADLSVPPSAGPGPSARPARMAIRSGCAGAAGAAPLAPGYRPGATVLLTVQALSGGPLPPAAPPSGMSIEWPASSVCLSSPSCTVAVPATTTQCSERLW